MQHDAELVAAVLDGQREAYAELVHRYDRTLLAAAGQILGNVHDAEDAVQEALVTAYQNLTALRTPAAFGAWALRIARRTALRMLRERSRMMGLMDAHQVASRRSDGRLDEETQQVLTAVMKLPERHRQVVLLRFFAKHSVREVAEMTGQAIGTVKSQLSRGVRRLRERLKEPQP